MPKGADAGRLPVDPAFVAADLATKLTGTYIIGCLDVPQWDGLKRLAGKMHVFQRFTKQSGLAAWLSGLQPKRFTVLL